MLNLFNDWVQSTTSSQLSLIIAQLWTEQWYWVVASFFSSVKTDMSSSVIVSTLFIANASPRDSGNYTCSLGDVATGGVLVHILDGEYQWIFEYKSVK